MEHLEIEFKTLLETGDFERLLKNFEKAEIIEQTNYYIDSPDFILRENRLALRVRTLATRAELTLKIPQKVGNMEYNQDLTLTETQVLLDKCQLPSGPIREKLEEVGIPLTKLGILGSLWTCRRELDTPIGLMALDKSCYLGQTDFELELEVTDAEKGEKDFHAFLKEQGISYQTAPSKLARFAKALGK